MSHSPDISVVLAPFQRVFTAPTWRKAQVLLIGTVLARGRRTVTAALRQMGLREATNFSLYHHVLNRARWSALQASHQLLVLLMRTFVTLGGMLTFVIDEKLERRWGPCIKKRGHDRDPLASSKQRSIATSGLRWIVLALIITPPWTQRSWALPVLSVLAPTPEVSQQLGLRHKTVARRARQMILVIRRWLPKVQITVLGDQAYSVLELGRACTRHGVRLIAPLRLDAALYAPAPPREPGTNGRPRVKGERLLRLEQVLTDVHTAWQRVRVQWYNGRWRVLEVASATAVWYRIGQPVLPIRWVLVRDPKGKLEPRAYLSTSPCDRARAIVVAFIKRWTLETTFEECHAHLGFETQRQWADQAIERMTPCLLGLYSLVTLLAHAFYPNGQLPFQATAWYAKSQATFADALAAVRRHLWSVDGYSTSAQASDLVEIPKAELERLLYAVCYSH
jgi:hypothetical protein